MGYDYYCAKKSLRAEESPRSKLGFTLTHSTWATLILGGKKSRRSADVGTPHGTMWDPSMVYPQPTVNLQFVWWTFTVSCGTPGNFKIYLFGFKPIFCSFRSLGWCLKRFGSWWFNNRWVQHRINHGFRCASWPWRVAMSINGLMGDTTSTAGVSPCLQLVTIKLARLNLLVQTWLPTKAGCRCGSKMTGGSIGW